MVVVAVVYPPKSIASSRTDQLPTSTSAERLSPPNLLNLFREALIEARDPLPYPDVFMQIQKKGLHIYLVYL